MPENRSCSQCGTIAASDDQFCGECGARISSTVPPREALRDRIKSGSKRLPTAIGSAVALTLALRRPDLVRKLVQISGGFNHDAEITMVGMSIDQMVEGTIAFLESKFARRPEIAAANV